MLRGQKFSVFLISVSTLLFLSTEVLSANAQYYYYPSQSMSTQDFSLASSPSSLTVRQGGSGTFNISITPTNGFSSAVTLSISGNPVNVTASFNPIMVTPSTSTTSTLTLSVAPQTIPGSYNLLIKGTSGSLSHLTVVILRVTENPLFSVIPTNSSVKIANNTVSIVIPSWIKNTARWWSQGSVGDNDFIKGLQYLIQNGIMKVPHGQITSHSSQIPAWIKNNAGWWSNGQISDDEFVKGIQYLISNGIIMIQS